MNRLETKHCFKSVRGSSHSQILLRKALNQSGKTTVTANPFSGKAIGNDISAGSVISTFLSPSVTSDSSDEFHDRILKSVVCCELRENRKVTLRNHKASRLQLPIKQVSGRKCLTVLKFELLKFPWAAIS